MAATAYDATFGIPITFTFTPTTGTPFGTDQAQAQELTPPDRKLETPKFTPISGANSGSEQFVIGKMPVGMIAVKATYGATEHAAALVCLAGKSKGTLVVTFTDLTGTSTQTFAGAALTGVKPGTINADNLRVDDLEFTVPLPGT